MNEDPIDAFSLSGEENFPGQEMVNPDENIAKTDRVVTSFDGYEAYLLIVDEATRHVWVFLTKSKDPSVDIAADFLK